MELITWNNHSAQLLQAVAAVSFGLLLVVIWRGRLRRSLPFLLPTLLGMAGILLGLLFRIQHWSYAETITGSSSLLLLATYGIWFSRKQPKTRLDFSKLAFVAALGIWGLSLGPYSGLFLPWLLPAARLLLTLSFGVLLLDFVYLTYIRRPVRS